MFSKLPLQDNPQTTTTRFDVFIVLSWYLEGLLVEQEADEWERLVTPPAPGPTWLFYTSTQLLFYTAGLLLNLRHILTSLLQMFHPLPSSKYNIDLCRNCLADLGSTLVASDDVNIRGRELPPVPLFVSLFHHTLILPNVLLFGLEQGQVILLSFFTTWCLTCTIRFLAEFINA